MSYYGRPKFLLKFEAGKSASIFFFFCISLLLFFKLDSNHVQNSKFQVITFKIERSMAKFPPKCLCIQINIYFRDSSITFERK